MSREADQRERQIIRLIADGQSNKEIAQQLNVATFTVKSHVHNVLEKLALRPRRPGGLLLRPRTDTIARQAVQRILRSSSVPKVYSPSRRRFVDSSGSLLYNMRAVLRIDPPLVRDVFEHLLKEAGDRRRGVRAELARVADGCRANVARRWCSSWRESSSGEPGICSHLLSENPQLKVVIMSTDHYAIADVGVRTMSGDALTVKAIRASLRALLDD